MQRDKSTNKIEQLGKVTKSSEQLTQSIADVIDKFRIKSIFRDMDFVKHSGILVSAIATGLMTLPFVGAANVLALFKSGLNNPGNGQKDIYYDIKNKPKINWRDLLLSIAKQFQYLVGQDIEIIEDAKKAVPHNTVTVSYSFKS